MSSQSDIFLQGEGNEWFSRNAESYSSGKRFIDLDYIDNSLLSFRNSINKILEIGCASGVKLKELTTVFDASGFGVDPSTQAISEAKRISQGSKNSLSFEVGVASRLPIQNQSFDLIYFSFCLYLVPPEEIESAYIEAHKLLAPGGFLVIHDFDANKEISNPYHHLAGITSYKRFNSKYFMDNFGYALVGKKSYSHESSEFSIDANERISIEILFKEV